MTFWKFLEFRLFEGLIGLGLAVVGGSAVLITLLYKTWKNSKG